VVLKNFTAFLLYGSLFIASGCSDKPSFSFSCESDKAGNYVLRWEVSPLNKNEEISIYMSDEDNKFPNSPILVAKVNDYRSTIPAQDSIRRRFFRLKVNKTFSGVITNRSFKFDNIQNFRDIGGYYTQNGEQVKWGKVYRSGELSEPSAKDIKILNQLGIKTIVDFRDTEEVTLYPNGYNADKNIHLPISTGNRSYIREQIINGTFLRGDAILFTQDIYRALVESYTDEFARFFDILCDEDNYPVVFHSYLGKDRVGIANFLLERALGVSHNTNEDDYLLSNAHINEFAVIGEAKYLPEQMQEAATIICQTDISYLNYAKSCMRNKSGSIDEYMEKELKLTPEKKNKLRRILLY
jgi:protein-tyrosine phosphatase